MQPRKILAIKLRALGDTVLLTAALAELRKAYPKAEIHALVTDAWAPLLDGHPGVNRILPYTRRKSAAARAKTVAQTAFRLRAEKYDLAVNFHASPSSSTLAFASGARVRSIHFHGHKDKNRYSTVTVPGKGTVKPAIERDMDVLRALGLQIPEGRLPQVHLSGSEASQGRARIEALGARGPVLALGLSASRPAKMWPIERFARVALDWIRETGGCALSVYGPGERGLHEELRLTAHRLAEHEGGPSAAELERKLLALEPLPIRALAGVLRSVSVMAGNDSGPRHLAVAVGTPTVTLFGPEHPLEWHPYPADRHPRFFLEGLECRRDATPGMPSWCAMTVCSLQGEGQHRCMRGIEADPVWNECRRLLAQ